MFHAVDVIYINRLMEITWYATLHAITGKIHHEGYAHKLPNIYSNWSGFIRDNLSKKIPSKKLDNFLP
jgi:hypothetical protein